MRLPLTTARRSTPDEPLLEVDHAGLSHALGVMLEHWMAGQVQVPKGSFVEKTRVVDGAGDTIGFNYYIVAEEPRHLGKMRVEVDGDPDSE